MTTMPSHPPAARDICEGVCSSAGRRRILLPWHLNSVSCRVRPLRCQEKWQMSTIIWPSPRRCTGPPAEASKRSGSQTCIRIRRGTQLPPALPNCPRGCAGGGENSYVFSISLVFFDILSGRPTPSTPVRTEKKTPRQNQHKKINVYTVK